MTTLSTKEKLRRTWTLFPRPCSLHANQNAHKQSVSSSPTNPPLSPTTNPPPSNQPPPPTQPQQQQQQKQLHTSPSTSSCSSASSTTIPSVTPPSAQPTEALFLRELRNVLYSFEQLHKLNQLPLSDQRLIRIRQHVQLSMPRLYQLQAAVGYHHASEASRLVILAENCLNHFADINDDTFRTWKASARMQHSQAHVQAQQVKLPSTSLCPPADAHIGKPRFPSLYPSKPAPHTGRPPHLPAAALRPPAGAPCVSRPSLHGAASPACSSATSTSTHSLPPLPQQQKQQQQQQQQASNGHQHYSPRQTHRPTPTQSQTRPPLAPVMNISHAQNLILSDLQSLPCHFGTSSSTISSSNETGRSSCRSLFEAPAALSSDEIRSLCSSRPNHVYASQTQFGAAHGYDGRFGSNAFRSNVPYHHSVPHLLGAERDAAVSGVRERRCNSDE